MKHISISDDTSRKIHLDIDNILERMRNEASFLGLTEVADTQVLLVWETVYWEIYAKIRRMAADVEKFNAD